jgi:transposase InsO family protein
MFDEQDFLHWCRRLKLSQQAEILIRHIRSSEPSRAVRSGRGNVSGRYPSRKMGVIIQFESHKNELARIYELEHDPDVIEYYDQPPPIKLNYEGKNGQQLGVVYTPDFFVIRTDAAGWEECKTEENLIELSEHNSNRYCCDEDKWHCPPGEEYALQFGLFFEVHSNKDINWTFHRNIEFLDDYFRASAPVIEDAARTALLACTTEEPGLSLQELLDKTQGRATRDDIYMLIAHEAVYVDLYDVPLLEADHVRVFADRETATAYSQLVQLSTPSTIDAPRCIDLSAGNFIQWDGAGWKIANAGEKQIGLIGENNSFSEIPRTTFEKLVIEGRITGVQFNEAPDTHPEVKHRLAHASREDFAEANRRAAIVRAHLQGESIPEPIPERTLYFWLANYRAAETSFGNGYIGLLPQPRKGNSTKKLPTNSQALLQEFIENDYETLKQKRKFEVYGAYLLACKRRGILAASYRTFCKAVKQRPRYTQTLKRQGRRASYKYEEFYWELEQTTPRHGERPLHIAHIDHTQADVELVDSITGANLGRPWVSFLTDAWSRRGLAVYSTYDPPSYRSCMMVMRECVRRFGRLPQIVVVDGGLEFAGIYFETFLARYESTKKTRPPAQARFGTPVERLFGTTNTQFFHNLLGNTQIMRNVRQVTKSVNPKGQAAWFMDKFYEHLCHYSYEVYDTNVHQALGVSPRDAFATGMLLGGERLHKMIPYNEEFRLFTLPTTKRGRAKVQPSQGVKINYIYYWSDAFRHPEVEGTRVPVRFDPWDMGRAYAFVRGQWVECISQHYAVFHNRSEHEVRIASEELRRRHRTDRKKFELTAMNIARFLESVEAEEVLLKQRMADRESRGIWQLINGGTGLSAPNVTDSATIVPPEVIDAPGDVLPVSSAAQAFQIYEEF